MKLFAPVVCVVPITSGVLRTNRMYDLSTQAYHYTPLYFPDGQYIVKVVKSDMWTPSGMIQSIDTTKPITISGNAYDDWYIGRK